MEDIGEIREDHNKTLRVEGIVVNQFQPRARLPQRLVGELSDEGLPMLQSRLSASVKIRESHDHSQPMIHLFPKHKLTAQFESLWNELNGIAPTPCPDKDIKAPVLNRG
jgi:chromosome partitioning protein